MKPIRVVAIVFLQALIWLGAECGWAFAAPQPGPQEIMSDMSSRLFLALGKESAAARRNADKVRRKLVDALPRCPFRQGLHRPLGIGSSLA